MTETAKLADIHLQVRPGGDAFLLSAMLALLVQEELLDHGFLEQRTQNYEQVIAAVEDIDATRYCRRAGVDLELARQAVRGDRATAKASRSSRTSASSRRLTRLSTPTSRSFSGR